MRKKKKYLAMVLAAIMTVPMLTGCIKQATPQNLFTDMEDSMSDLDSMEGTFKLNMKVDESGTSTKMNMDLKFSSDLKNKLSHLVGTASLGDSDDYSGQSDLELYQQFDDDEYNMYASVDAGDTWELLTGENSSSKEFGIDGVGDYTQFADDFERKEETSVDGKDCYQLEGEIEGDKIDNLLGGGVIENLLDLDFGGMGDISVPCTICIDKKDIRLASVSLDLASYVESYMEKAMGDEEDEEDFRVKTFTLDIQVKKYNGNVDLTIPKEALNADSSGDDDDDGYEDGYEDDYGDDYDYDDDGFDDTTGTYEPGTPDKNLSKDWESGQVQINDTIIQLPCSLADIEKSGFKLDTETDSPDQEIGAGDNTKIVYIKDENGNKLLAGLDNISDSAKKLSKCQVTGLSAYNNYLRNGGVTVIFPGNVQIGSKKDEVMETLGEPSSEYEEYYSWYNSGNDFLKSFSVMLDGDKVSSIYYSVNDTK